MKNHLYRYGSTLLVFLALFSTLSQAHAVGDEPAADTEYRIILKLSWRDDQGQTVDKNFSLADIERMPQTALALTLPEAVGIAGTHAWQGVTVSSLIALSGRKPHSLKVAALNGYSVSVPVEDIQRFNPILSFRRDGALISVREKGPFLLIYPFNTFPELNQQIYLNRLVWQVNEITLQ